MGKNSDFLGRAALIAHADKPLGKRLVGFTLENPAVILVGRETILRNGEPVGYLTSGGFGYTVNKSIGYGYVRNEGGVTDDFLTTGSYELVVANDCYPADIFLRPLYDPTNARVKS
jgi:4-methylaminobutanoate oxidase (formaldehyde-forming)